MTMKASTPLRIALFGECMIELQGEAFGLMRQTYGGDTLNTAVYLARLGNRHGWQISYATGLGDDRFSDGMLERWASEHIDTHLVRRLQGRVPGLYTISLDPRGERTFTYWRDQAAVRSYFEMPPGVQTPLEAEAASLRMLYFSGISLAILAPPSRERLFAVARQVRHHGGQVVFDNNYRPRLWPDAQTARDAFDQAMCLSDIALVTLDDEMLLHGESDPAISLARVLECTCPEIVVKRGSQPVVVREQGRPVAEVPAEQVQQVVDTTAAGDSFAAAYLAAKLQGASSTTAAAAGSRLAALVIQHKGAIIAPELMAGY